MSAHLEHYRGKKILVTGVVNSHSIAYAIAERAQEEGAEVILTSFGRIRRMTERAAKKLPQPPEVLELDVNREEDFPELSGALKERWGHIDGAVHAIAYAPADAIGGNFLGAPRESAKIAFETSAYSFKALAEALAPLMGPEPGASANGASPMTAPGNGSLLTLDFDASVAWPSYDWMGVSKAALEAEGIAGFSDLAELWTKMAPLGWDEAGIGAVADAAVFLLSDLSRGISGEIIHVDGGAHAIGGELPAPADATASESLNVE